MCKPAGPAKLKCREICNSTPPCYICRCITRKDHPGARKMNRDITTATATSSPDAVLSQENIASKYESPQTLAVREKAIRERQWSVVISCTVAIILCLTTGISISITSNVILDLEMGLPAHQLTTFQQSVFAALASVGAIVGGPAGGWVADYWGRKCSLMFSGLPIATGYLLLSYAHFSSAARGFVITLYIGRFMTGLGMGAYATCISVYISEISSTKLRGLFGTANETFVTVGVSINYALGAIPNFFYYNIALVTVGIACLFEVLMFWMPETPRSLLSRGYTKEAENVLKWLRGPHSDISTNEFKEIKQHIISNRRQKKQPWKHVFRKSVTVPFLYLLVIFVVKQFCGINAILSFAGEIFVKAGVSNPRITTVYAIGVSSLLGILVAFLTADYLGRKTLLVTSGILMTIGAGMLGTHFYITRPSLCDQYPDAFNDTTPISDVEPYSSNTTDSDLTVCNPHLGPLSIVSLIVYIFGFSMGWGPLPWVVLSELLPLSVCGTASGLCTLVSFAASTVVVGTYLEYVELVGPWFTMWTFAVISLAGSVFVLVFIPETKGKSLETLERGFEGSSIHLLC